jgi:hypothetical protein
MKRKGDVEAGELETRTSRGSDIVRSETCLVKLCSGPNSVCGLSTGCLGRIPRHSEGIANVRE